MMACAPTGVCCANLALARLNNMLHGAFAHAQKGFCHSFLWKSFFQLAYICLAQYICSAFGAHFSTAFKIPCRKT
jgi:hypothetical protein